MLKVRALLVFVSLGAAIPVRAATWYVDCSVAESGDGKSWDTPFRKIQEGIDAASDGDAVIVGEGVYRECVWFRGPNITLRSRDPLDAAVVTASVIGFGCVIFSGLEDETCVLSGFTIRDGSALYEPERGITGRGTHATIRNNVITNNGDSASGGGIAECHGLIENNLITNNAAGDWWSSEGYGGGLYDCDGTIRNNIIASNAVHSVTGGPDPYRRSGQGAGLAYCDGIIEGNLIVGNKAYDDGGGLHSCNGTVRNNIIVANSASDGGGLHDCYGSIRNCIIWANRYLEGPQIASSSTPTYSCIQDWTGGGEGNISEDPRFVDAENGDFRLRADSPCIDAGFNDPELPETDIAGMHRIMFGGNSLTVDIGAYEFYANELKLFLGKNKAVLSWSSLSDKTYSIFYTDDLFNWHTAIANFPSSGNQTTSWTDDGSLTGVLPSLVPRRFYRLLENP